MKAILIKNARVFDPREELDRELDVKIEDGRIVKMGGSLNGESRQVIEAKGRILVPGLVDLHVHFREPGFEHRETIETGARAALKGGFVAALSMPNTDPPCDNQSVIKTILTKAEAAQFRVRPCGTISKGREGKELSEMAELRDAGCVAVSDDGNYVRDSLLMRHAMEYASMFDLLVISHSEDEDLARNGVMNEGRMSTILGLRGIPHAAEEIAVMRDIALAKLVGSRLHLAHLSTRGAVELVRKAKADGVRVTCEVTPHHFSLTDESLANYDTVFKMRPPLRTRHDVEGILEGLRDGTIDVIASDHAPHTEDEKELEFVDAPNGVIGLETALGVVLTELFHKGILDLRQVVEKMAIRPAELIGLKDFNRIREGNEANLTLVDLEKEWQVRKEDFVSKSKNSCFLGRQLKGKAVATIAQGKAWALDPVRPPS